MRSALVRKRSSPTRTPISRQSRRQARSLPPAMKMSPFGSSTSRRADVGVGFRSAGNLPGQVVVRHVGVHQRQPAVIQGHVVSAPAPSAPVRAEPSGRISGIETGADVHHGQASRVGPLSGAPCGEVSDHGLDDPVIAGKPPQGRLSQNLISGSGPGSETAPSEPPRSQAPFLHGAGLVVLDEYVRTFEEPQQDAFSSSVRRSRPMDRLFGSPMK